MVKIEELKFDEKGLIPAIVVDDFLLAALQHFVETFYRESLGFFYFQLSHYRKFKLAYMNRESLAISMEEKRTCFWSRSRQELWRKGETRSMAGIALNKSIKSEMLPAPPEAITGTDTKSFTARRKEIW